MPDKCVYDQNRDCPGLNRANEVAGDVKALDKRIDEFQHNVSETNSRFGTRIGKLEAREEVREEQYKHVQEKLEGIRKDMDDLKHLEEDVKKLKEKPAKTWENIKERGLGWVVGLICAIIAIALGPAQVAVR